jgi:hypothetical protein
MQSHFDLLSLSDLISNFKITFQDEFILMLSEINSKLNFTINL